MEELISLLLVDMAHAQLRTDSNSLESVTNAGTAKPLMQRLVQTVGAGRANLLACAVSRGGCNAPHLSEMETILVCCFGIISQVFLEEIHIHFL